MATITTKFSVGDTVYHAGTATEARQHPCPDCLGERKWKAVSPAGDEFSFGCPRCNTSYSAHDDMSLKYTAFAPSVRRMTIGSVRYDSHSFNEGERYDYMCNETGVGSGSIYRERDLFKDEQSAVHAAELKCAHQNTTTEWVAKRFNRTLEISDYQLSSASLKIGQEAQSKARSLLYNIGDLFATIREADDKEAILEAVEEYQSWHMAYDLREAASVDTHPKGGDAKQAPSLMGSAVGEAETPKASKDIGGPSQ